MSGVHFSDYCYYCMALWVHHLQTPQLTATSHWIKCLSVSWDKISVKIWLIRKFSRKGVILCLQNTYQYFSIFDTAELWSFLPQSIYSIIIWPLTWGGPKQIAMKNKPHYISAGYDCPPKWYFCVPPRLNMCFLVCLD